MPHIGLLKASGTPAALTPLNEAGEAVTPIQGQEEV